MNRSWPVVEPFSRRLGWQDLHFAGPQFCLAAPLPPTTSDQSEDNDDRYRATGAIP